MLSLRMVAVVLAGLILSAPAQGQGWRTTCCPYYHQETEVEVRGLVESIEKGGRPSGGLDDAYSGAGGQEAIRHRTRSDQPHQRPEVQVQERPSGAGDVCPPRGAPRGHACLRHQHGRSRGSLQWTNSPVARPRGAPGMETVARSGLIWIESVPTSYQQLHGWVERDLHTDQVCERFGLHFFHHVGPVNLHRSL